MGTECFFFFSFFFHLGLRWSPQYKLLKVTQRRPGVCQMWTYFPNAAQTRAVVSLIWRLLIESSISNMFHIHKGRWEEADALLSSPPPTAVLNTAKARDAGWWRPSPSRLCLPTEVTFNRGRICEISCRRERPAEERQARRVHSWTSHVVRVRRITLLKTVSEIVLQSLVSPRLREKPNKTPKNL